MQEGNKKSVTVTQLLTAINKKLNHATKIHERRDETVLFVKFILYETPLFNKKNIEKTQKIMAKRHIRNENRERITKLPKKKLGIFQFKHTHSHKHILTVTQTHSHTFTEHWYQRKTRTMSQTTHKQHKNTQIICNINKREKRNVVFYIFVRHSVIRH